MRWLLLLVPVLMTWAAPARAWGDSGHMTVCQIAYLNLTPVARSEVDRLIAVDSRFHTFASACTAPDHPHTRGPEHFVNYPRTRLTVTGPSCGLAATCVIGAIHADLVVLTSAKPLEAREKALRYVGHWLGDVHQPLHVSYADDRGGNLITALGPCSADNLHSAWDTCVIDTMLIQNGARAPSRMPQPPPALNDDERAAGIEELAAQLNGEITSAERHDWTLEGRSWRWAAESYALTLRLETQYCERKSGACWYDKTERSYSGGPKKRVDVKETYLTAAAVLVRQRLKQAGVRLADVLNAAFDPAYHRP